MVAASLEKPQETSGSLDDKLSMIDWVLLREKWLGQIKHDGFKVRLRRFSTMSGFANTSSVEVFFNRTLVYTTANGPKNITEPLVKMVNELHLQALKRLSDLRRGNS